MKNLLKQNFFIRKIAALTPIERDSDLPPEVTGYRYMMDGGPNDVQEITLLFHGSSVRLYRVMFQTKMATPPPASVPTLMDLVCKNKLVDVVKEEFMFVFECLGGRGVVVNEVIDRIVQAAALVEWPASTEEGKGFVEKSVVPDVDFLCCVGLCLLEPGPMVLAYWPLVCALSLIATHT